MKSHSGLSIGGRLILAGSFSLRDIVDAQAGTFWGFIPRWNIFQGPFVAFFIYSDGGVRRNQPHPVRLARSRDGAGGGISHRVQRHEVRHVFYGRVRQHDHGGLPGHFAISWADGTARCGPPMLQAILPVFWFAANILLFSFFIFGCAGRCRASGTTNSWRSDGSFCCRWRLRTWWLPRW